MLFKKWACIFKHHSCKRQYTQVIHTGGQSHILSEPSPCQEAGWAGSTDTNLIYAATPYQVGPCYKVQKCALEKQESRSQTRPEAFDTPKVGTRAEPTRNSVERGWGRRNNQKVSPTQLLRPGGRTSPKWMPYPPSEDAPYCPEIEHQSRGAPETWVSLQFQWDLRREHQGKGWGVTFAWVVPAGAEPEPQHITQARSRRRACARKTSVVPKTYRQRTRKFHVN